MWPEDRQFFKPPRGFFDILVCCPDCGSLFSDLVAIPVTPVTIKSGSSHSTPRTSTIFFGRSGVGFTTPTIARRSGSATSRAKRSTRAGSKRTRSTRRSGKPKTS